MTLRTIYNGKQINEMSREEIGKLETKELQREMSSLARQNQIVGIIPENVVASTFILIELCHREGRDPRPILQKHHMLDEPNGYWVQERLSQYESNTLS